MDLLSGFPPHRCLPFSLKFAHCFIPHLLFFILLISFPSPLSVQLSLSLSLCFNFWVCFWRIEDWGFPLNLKQWLYFFCLFCSSLLSLLMMVILFPSFFCCLSLFPCGFGLLCLWVFVNCHFKHSFSNLVFVFELIVSKHTSVQLFPYGFWAVEILKSYKRLISLFIYIYIYTNIRSILVWKWRIAASAIAFAHNLHNAGFLPFDEINNELKGNPNRGVLQPIWF